MTRPTLRERLRYRSDQFFQSGFTLQLFISAIIVLAVITLFYIIAEVAGVHPGPDFGVQSGQEDGPYWPSVRLWWVIMHVMESYWLETGTFSQILSIFLTLFNFLVFAAIVGLVGSRIQQRLEQVRRGTSRVIEEEHIVILGWSGKVIPILHELREGLENRKQVYVIASERPIDEIETRMRKSFPKRSMRSRWVIRQGSLTDLKDLELLAIDRAREVIILRQDMGNGNDDVQVVKTIMAAAHIIERRSETDLPYPDLIAEIEVASFVPLAIAAARNVPLSIIQPSDNLSKIILQTARQEGLVDVYNELLSHHSNEFHFTPADDLTGSSWEDVVFSFRTAIPVGVFRDGKPLLAPADSGSAFQILPDDCIIAVARTEADMRSTGVRKPQTLPVPKSVVVSLEPIRNVLLLGWNEKVFPLLKEYAAYARSARMQFAVTLVSPGLPAGLTAGEVSSLIGTDDELSILLRKVDYLASDVVEELGPGNFDAIIVLDEDVDDAHIEDADTRVIMTLLLLRALRDRAEKLGRPFPPQQQIVGEIFNVSNKDLAESTGSLRDVIISNDLVSKMIAQVCRERRTEFVMQDLFDEEGKEIYLKPALRYAEAGAMASFDQLLLASVRKGEVAIGFARGNIRGAGRELKLNPPRESMLRIDEELHLVVVAESETDEGS
ncbi:MAG: hypothetical protein IH600_04470 [Bacteroidetes bacterium]|nr:hypothetical protein [Bacteroidota bacterium]